MLNANPARRANIQSICSHWWTNETYAEICLDVAEELAKRTPVRLDLLLSLPTPAVNYEKLVVDRQIRQVCEYASILLGNAVRCGVRAPSLCGRGAKKASRSKRVPALILVICTRTYVPTSICTSNLTPSGEKIIFKFRERVRNKEKRRAEENCETPSEDKNKNTRVGITRE